MSERIIDKTAMRVIPFLVYLILRCWFATCRVKIHGEENLEKVLKMGKPGIASFWHYSLGYVFYNLRKQQATVMVSASKDGEYIARLAGYFGFQTVRGSKNKRGLLALKEMMKKIKNGSNAGIVADGSQGPPLKLQAGTILLASKCGAPIVPVVWSANRYFAFGSWDRLSLPKPFAEINYYYGEPFMVPERLSQEGIEEYRLQLEAEMNSLYKKAWAVYGKEEH